MRASPVGSPIAPPDAPTLVRALGVRALAANIVNTIVGSGIFVLPAVVAAILCPSAVIAYIVCAALVNSMIFAQRSEFALSSSERDSLAARSG